MENKYDNILIRFLLNEVNLTERKFVLNWIKESENNRQYLMSLADTLKLVAVKKEIKAINIDKEWNHFQQLKEFDNEKPIQNNELPPGKEELQNEELLFNDKNNYRKTKILKLWAFVTVAASIIIILFINLGAFNNNNNNKTSKIAAQKKEGKTDKPKLLMIVMLQERNNSGKIKNINFPDGSHILLFPNSEITFQEPSDRSRREVLLKGKADFEVAKNKAKPFTVNSGDISTTAIGTHFTVTAYENAKNITVRLYEGKVMIKTLYTEKVKLKNDIYLLPGQEFFYDKQNLIAKVRGFKINMPVAQQDKNDSKTYNDDPSIPENKNGSWYMFNNQSLPQVFEQLKEMYQVQIIYLNKDVDKMYFIGKFDKTDSVVTILKQIGLLNNLKIDQKNNKFIITKKP